MATSECTVEHIYQDYREKVLRYVRLKIPRLQDAEDVCSSVFLKIHKGLPYYDASKASISTWVYSIAHNAVVDFYRRAYAFEQLDEALACEENCFEDIFSNETLEELASALECLPPRERNIIILHYYSGIPLKEIANSMAMSYSNLKVLHKKALAFLKKHLQFD